MTLLYNGDCNELMSEIADDSVDLIFTDLPYGQVSCDWDKKIDLSKMWDHFLRIKKEKTPIFFCCSTKFGAELIQSAPKKCPFRYDIVWVKSAPCGFLSARKMPMRKHEMLYVFYEKLPFYDLSSHKHKFIKEKPFESKCETAYGKATHHSHRDKVYDPPLPVSVQKEGQNGTIDGNEVYKGDKVLYRSESGLWEPPLPTSVQKEIDNDNIYRGGSGKPLKQMDKESGYEPPLPTSVQKEEQFEGIYNGGEPLKQMRDQSGYDPPLPNSILEIKSQRGKHSTQKPTELMKWVLKYYSKEGDVVLDPTMGSGSTGVACLEMKRNFIGIELDPEIFEDAEMRLS